MEKSREVSKIQTAKKLEGKIKKVNRSSHNKKKNNHKATLIKKSFDEGHSSRKKHRLKKSFLMPRTGKRTAKKKMKSQVDIEKLVKKMIKKKQPTKIIEKNFSKISLLSKSNKKSQCSKELLLTQKKRPRGKNKSILFQNQSLVQQLLQSASKKYKTPKLKIKTLKKKKRCGSKSKSKSRSKSRSRSSISKSRSKSRGKKKKPVLDKPSKKSFGGSSRDMRKMLKQKIQENSARKIQKFWKKKLSEKQLRKSVVQISQKTRSDFEDLIPVRLKSTPRGSQRNSFSQNPIGSSLIFKEVSGMDNTSRTLIRLEEGEGNRYSSQTRDLSFSILSNPNLGIEEKFKGFAQKQLKRWDRFLREVNKATAHAGKRDSLVELCFDYKKKGEMSIKLLKESLKRKKKKGKRDFKKKGKRSYLNFESKDEYRGIDEAEIRFEDRITERNNCGDEKKILQRDIEILKERTEKKKDVRRSGEQERSSIEDERRNKRLDRPEKSPPIKMKMYNQEKWIDPEMDISGKVMSKLVSNSKHLLSSLSFKGSKMTSSMNLSRSRSIHEQEFHSSEKIKMLFEGKSNLLKSLKDKRRIKNDSVPKSGRLSLEQRKSLDNSRRLKNELDGIKDFAKNKQGSSGGDYDFNFRPMPRFEEFGVTVNSIENTEKELKEDIKDSQISRGGDESIVDETNVKLEESSKEVDIDNDEASKKLIMSLNSKKKNKRAHLHSNFIDIEIQKSKEILKSREKSEMKKALESLRKSQRKFSLGEETVYEYSSEIQTTEKKFQNIEREMEISHEQKETTIISQKEIVIDADIFDEKWLKEQVDSLKEEAAISLSKSKDTRIGGKSNPEFKIQMSQSISKKSEEFSIINDDDSSRKSYPVKIQVPDNFTSGLVYHNKNDKNLDPLFNSSEIETISRFSSLESTANKRIGSIGNSPLVKKHQEKPQQKFKINKSTDLTKKQTLTKIIENNEEGDPAINSLLKRSSCDPDEVKEILDNFSKKISKKEKKEPEEQVEEEVEEESFENDIDNMKRLVKHLDENIKPKKAMIQQQADRITDFILDSLISELSSEGVMRSAFGQKEEKEVEYVEPVPLFSDIDNILEYLKNLYHEINITPEEQKMIHQRLNTPIGPNNFHRLMMCSSSVLNQDFEIEGGFDYEQILDIRLYISLEEKLRDSLYVEKELSASQMEREHILHKMIFDSLNEKLDHRRVFGLKGIPMNYQTSSKEPKTITARDCARILETSRNEIMQWAMMRNGVLPEKEPVLQKIQDVDAVEIVREETMQRLLDDYVSILKLIYRLG